MHRRDALKTVGGVLVLGSLVGRRASAHPGPFRPLGTLDIAGAKEAVVSEDGATAYVAATDGFAIADVSTPSRIELLAEERNLLADRENGPLAGIYDVKVEGDRLVVAGPADPQRGEVLQGFALYDVADLANPEQLAFFETDYPIHNCFLRDGVAYLTGNDGAGNPLVMVDVSDDEPEEVGRWSLVDVDQRWSDVDPFVRTLHDVWVQDGVAYLAHWDAGTWLVDVGDPASPEAQTHIGGQQPGELAEIPGEGTRAATLELPGNDHYVQVNDDASLLAINREAWDVPGTQGGGPGGVELWDLGGLGEPRKVATIDPPQTGDATQGGTWTTSHNFDIVGDRLFTSWYQGGVKIHDISDPANPEELAWWRMPNEASFWTARSAVKTTGPTLSEEGFFVASSFRAEDGGSPGLYTFPEERGDQKNPPSLTAVAGDATGTGDQSGTTGQSAGGTTTTETEAGAVGEQTPTESDGQPGFGILTGLGALGLGAWRALGDDRRVR